MNKIILETDRLILRELTYEDIDDLYKVLGDESIMGHYTFKFDRARVEKWIEKNIKRYEDYSFGLWAVIEKESGDLIGDCGLTIQNINENYLPEIGYHIRADKQRRGYAKEAAIAVRKWAFENTPFKRLYSYMKKSNVPSQNTAKSTGMTYVGQYLDKSNDPTVYYVYEKNQKTKG